MKNKIIIILSILVITNLNSFAQSKYENWFDKISKIKAGISTKEDAERLFDSPIVDRINKFKGSEDIYYKTRQGRLRVTYSLSRCSEGSDDYNFEKGTVIGFSFYAFKSIRISKLKLDLKQFKNQKESDTENWYYSNADLGIIYVLSRNKLLTEVNISLTKIQDQQYSCTNKS